MDEKRWQAVEFSYTITEQGARVDQVREAESLVAIPEEIEGRPVTELGAYALSGSSVEKIYLPSGLRRIGAYAFYNCERLREIVCYSRVTDLGAGLFAGVRGVERLDMTLIPGEKSCLKDMLSELRQTLRVRLREEREDREDQNAGQTDTSRTVGQIKRQQVETGLTDTTNGGKAGRDWAGEDGTSGGAPYFPGIFRGIRGKYTGPHPFYRDPRLRPPVPVLFCEYPVSV